MPQPIDILPTFKGNAVIQLGDVVIIATDNVVFISVARELGLDIANQIATKMVVVFPNRHIVILPSRPRDTFSYTSLDDVRIDTVVQTLGDGIEAFLNGLFDG